MRRILLILAGLLTLGGISYATITLNTSQIQQFQQGSTTVETDNVASATSVTTNFPAQMITITVQLGSTSTGSFVAGTHAQTLYITVNAQTGVVFVSDGRPNIQLTSTQQAAIQNVLKGFQNGIETFLVNQGIISGTQVPN